MTINVDVFWKKLDGHYDPAGWVTLETWDENGDISSHVTIFVTDGQKADFKEVLHSLISQMEPSYAPAKVNYVSGDDV